MRPGRQRPDRSAARNQIRVGIALLVGRVAAVEGHRRIGGDEELREAMMEGVEEVQHVQQQQCRDTVEQQKRKAQAVGILLER